MLLSEMVLPGISFLLTLTFCSFFFIFFFYRNQPTKSWLDFKKTPKKAENKRETKNNHFTVKCINNVRFLSSIWFGNSEKCKLNLKETLKQIKIKYDIKSLKPKKKKGFIKQTIVNDGPLNRTHEEWAVLSKSIQKVINLNAFVFIVCWGDLCLNYTAKHNHQVAVMVYHEAKSQFQWNFNFHKRLGYCRYTLMNHYDFLFEFTAFKWIYCLHSEANVRQ